MKKEVVKTAEKMCEFSPRLWKNERKAAKLIKDKLDEKEVNFKVQQYDVVYPTFPEYSLKADGEKIECLPSGLKSGRIEEKTVLDNLNASNIDKPNLNFNPKCSGMSKNTMYEAPALTIARKDVQKILEADKIEGKLEVKWEQHKSQNILVGNTDDPRTVVFTHYDSWWGGFIDNAFSVSALIHLAPELNKEDILLVFAGSEEVSNEEQYWCYGYRKFEESYNKAVQNCERIVVVDTVGRGETSVISDDEHLLEQALVLNDRDYVEKTELVAGEFDKVMEIYHSPIDTRDKLTHPKNGIETIKECVNS